MAQSRPSVQKRNNDAKKAERKLAKAAKRAARAAAQVANRAAGQAMEGDPDLAGIVAGPQPRRDDEDEEFER